MAWGQTASERRAERASGSGKFFIRSFDTKETRIRIQWDDPFNTFVEYEEHFDRASKVSYPCAKFAGYTTCVGCEFPLPDNHDPEKAVTADGKPKREGCGCAGCQVRKRTSTWLFPALNEEGYLNIYKIGYKLWMSLRGKYELFGTITNRDYAIIHAIDESKSGPSAHSYDAVPLDDDQPRQAKTRVPDFGRLLLDKYLNALKKYEVDPESVGVDPADAVIPDPEPIPDSPDDPAPEHVDVAETPVDDEPAPEAGGIVTAESLSAQLAKLGVTAPPGLGVDVLSQLLSATAANAAPAAPAATPAAAPAAAVAAPAANGNGEAGPRDFTTWTTQDVRDFLKETPAVEFSPTAPRSQLLKLAEAKEKQLTPAG